MTMPAAFARAACPTASWQGRSLLPADGVYQLCVVVGVPFVLRRIGCAVAPPSPRNTITWTVSERPCATSSRRASSIAGAIGVQYLCWRQLSVDTNALEVLTDPFEFL